MRRDIIKFSLLSFFLIVISLVIISIYGRTYTVYIDNSNRDSCVVKFDNFSENVKVLEKHQKKDKYYVKIKSKKPGKGYLILNCSDNTEIKYLYVHKSMIITDNTYFGKTTGSEVIPISLSIILAYALYFLIKRYRYSMRDNIYQYKNIAILGIIIFLLIFLVDIVRSIFHYRGLDSTINDVISSVSSVSFYLFPIAFITFVLVTISNIKLIVKEGRSLRNILGLLFGVFICLSTLFPDFLYRTLMKSQKIDIYNLNSIGPYLYNFIESLIYLSVSYLECVLLGTIIIGIKSVRKKISYDKDYMIILGCKIGKDGMLPPLLKGRVDKAIEFRNEQLNTTGKDLVFIPSGGKGFDEVMPEAEAIKNYLLKQGIKKSHIMVEDKSKNTYENIKFSNKLIKEKNSSVGFATTNYHVLRAGLIATSQGLKVEGIGSKTKAYFWINAFIREFIGTLYSEKKKHILVIVSIIVVLMIMIWISYITNNIHKFL